MTLFKTKLSSVLLTSCLVFGCNVAWANEITLTRDEDEIVMRGTLLRYEDGYYVIKTSLGQMTVNSAMVECTGDACPKTDGIDANFRIAGSDTIGIELMPLLIKGMAAQNGTAVGNERSQGGHLSTMTAVKDNGRGDKDFTAVVEARGSSSGFQALLSETADLAMSSRPIKSEEHQALLNAGAGDMRSRAQEHVIAADGIIISLNPENPVDQLTEAEIAALLSGRITNWRQVGGEDVPVKVYTRNGQSGTSEMIKSRFLNPQNASFARSSKVVLGNAEMAEGIFLDKGAIGYLSAGYDTDTKPVAITSRCGITTMPSEFTIKTEEYPLQRRLYVYHRNGELPQTVKALLSYTSSDAAAGSIEKAGFVSWNIVQQSQQDIAQALRSQITDTQSPTEQNLARALYIDLLEWDRLSSTFRFQTGSSILDNLSQQKLVRLANYIVNLPAGSEITLTGFTDSDGAFNANQRLSEGRAMSVREQLEVLLKGTDVLDRVKINVKGYGPLNAVACNDDYLAQGLNRRVEVWVRPNNG
ncbi:phosphate ABC transporter substrate-binding/OmpA family protein [Parasulfitobacter algicola]|uniref:Substrate-binding domain-containing protein n=1 Tax=Parasulfitobacter algicola TaxID=2614809 RepID=A0ABX2IV82_9RHOB|nr:phosphate ABC transporter substrate-binding/OmpA family protein [Sulfitobacter algicola]NSX54103.1 substrate-binding domain-containing protein [Sulfitobacter algicola]